MGTTTSTTGSTGGGLITALGTGSGLDLSGLLTNILAAEKTAPQNIITQRVTATKTTVSALGTLKSSVSALNDALATLKDAKSFGNNTATSSDSNLFTVTADATAETANYNIGVINLASANKIASGNFASPGTIVGTGKLTITSGTGANPTSFDVTIDGTNNSLAGIRDAINNATGNTTVKASVLTVSDGAGGTASKLVLTSNSTGANSQIGVTVADGSDANNTDNLGLSQLYYAKSDTVNSRFSEVNAAKDALITIDGFQATSSTNVFKDSIAGVTITAVKGQSATDTTPPQGTLSVAPDQASVKTAIQKFVSAYNAYAFTYNQLTSYDKNTDTAGPLLGNSSVGVLSSRIRQGLTNAVTGTSANFSALSGIGITTADDGSLTIDDKKLSAALKNNLADVGKLFSGTNGIAGRLNTQLTDALSTKGVFQNTQNTLDAKLKDLANQQTKLDAHMVQVEASYRAQFTALDTIVAQLKQTGNFLTQQLASTTSSSK
jgi:flagellar hook-associated protein 2